MQVCQQPHAGALRDGCGVSCGHLPSWSTAPTSFRNQGHGAGLGWVGSATGAPLSHHPCACVVTVVCREHLDTWETQLLENSCYLLPPESDSHTCLCQGWCIWKTAPFPHSRRDDPHVPFFENPLPPTPLALLSLLHRSPSGLVWNG